MKTADQWLAEYPLLGEMRECIQDPEWHAEGDVWTHTLMVRDALHADSEFKELPARVQDILDTAVIWHDCGKPDTRTVTEDGHIHHPRHGIKGALRAYAELYRGGEYDFDALKDIYYLIRFHGRPAWVMEEGVKMINEISQTISCRLLSIFVRADMNGRVCKNIKSQEDGLAGAKLFRELAEQVNCLDTPYRFDSGFACWDYFEHRNRDGNFDYQAYDEHAFGVFYTCGFPASGISTSTRSCNMPVISLDAIREEMGLEPGEFTGQFLQESAERCRVLMRKKTPFVFDACNVDKRTRQKWINFFWEYRGITHIHHLFKPYKQLLIDNKSRAVYPPERVIENMINKFQLPDPFEAPKVTYHYHD